MYTQMKLNTNGFYKHNLISFVSFIFSFFNNELLNGVFEDAVFPGFGGFYFISTNRDFFCHI